MIPPEAKRSYQEIVEHLLAKLQEGGVISDLAPGGVARTLVEATAREFSETYARMHAVYQAGFVETATGASLDQLVAILGLTRIEGEASVADLRLLRDRRLSARVVVPTGTEVAIDRAGGDRVIYRVTDDHELREGEQGLVVPIRAMPAAGQTQADVALGPDDVAAGAAILLRPIAGIGGLRLEGPSVALGVSETDAQLRTRARMAIAAAGGGTAKALTDALMAVPPVKAVQLRDATVIGEDGLPVVAPGELDIVLDATSEQIEDHRAQIDAAIATHKGPGTLVRVSRTATRTLSGALVVKPASMALTGAQVLKLVEACEAILREEIDALPIGGTLVWNRVLARLMGVENLADIDTAASGLSLGGSAPELGDIALGPFERMAVGEGAEVVVVRIADRPVKTLAVTVRPGMAEPAADVAQALDDVLVAALAAQVEALNAGPAGRGRSVRLMPVLDRVNAPGVRPAALPELTPGTAALLVVDKLEQAEQRLDTADAQAALDPADVVRLADDPVTVIWEPPTP